MPVCQVQCTVKVLPWVFGPLPRASGTRQITWIP
jgi:hypothetical protein